MKPRMKLRLVRAEDRPLAALTMAEKRANAIAWLRERNRYILDRGTPAKFGVPGPFQKERSK